MLDRQCEAICRHNETHSAPFVTSADTSSMPSSSCSPFAFALCTSCMRSNHLSVGGGSREPCMEGLRAANMQAPCNAGQVLSGLTHPHACTDSKAPLSELSYNLTPGAARGTRNKHLHDHVCIVDGIHSENCQADRSNEMSNTRAS